MAGIAAKPPKHARATKTQRLKLTKAGREPPTAFRYPHF